MELFTGTPAQLCEHLKKEFINNKAFTLEQIKFTPTDDAVVSSVTTDEFSLSFSNKESEQLTGHKIFDNSYIYGFQDTFYKGLLYQLTFIAVYKDGENVKTFTPTLPCDRAEWENYWQSNTPDKDCIVYAAVNLLEGENLHKNVTLEELDTEVSDIKSDVSTISRTVDNTYIFDVAELKSKSLLTITRSAMTETGDEAYPYAVEYEQRLKYGNTNDITGELISDINTDLGIKYYKKARWEPTILGGNLDVLYVGDNVATDYPHRLHGVLNLVVGGFGSTATSNVELYQQSNIQFIHIKTIVKFPANPTETNIIDIENYLNGEANSRGRYVKKIYIRIEVPKTKEVSVL